MSELHLLVVFDTKTKTFRVAGMNEAPVDSDAYVWDPDDEEWREPTEAEMSLDADAEGYLNELLEGAVLT